MSTEADTLIPVVHHTPEKIVFVGDHKQLQPIIKSKRAEILGLNRTLFKRYATKLDTNLLTDQYRMHSSIAEIPSLLFYDNKLKSPLDWQNAPPPLEIWPNQQKACVFCHVAGREDSKLISTAEAGESSKGNIDEAKHTVKIVKYLRKKKVNVGDIAILTLYRAQVEKIKGLLDEIVKNEPEWKKLQIDQVCVQTVVKSQGSEWKYVILSCVRSQPHSLIEDEPSVGWIARNLGFVSDPHQINVGLTRSKHGLFIIGKSILISKENSY